MKRILFVLFSMVVIMSAFSLTSCNNKPEDKINIEVTTAKPTTVTRGTIPNTGNEEYSPRY